MKGSCGGVGNMSSEFERLNIGECESNTHPLLIRVGWSVMIIDDHKPNSQFQLLDRIHLLFFHSGFEVHICVPSEALSLLKQNKNAVDFVICNIHMKGIDEATLFELVGLKDVLVIMMSTHMDTRLVTEGMNHGACSFILRPKSWEDIQNISSFMLERKKYPSKLPWKLHKKFVEVVDQLGGVDEAVPEKIVKLMNAENIIPLEVIADHLKVCRVLARVAVPCSSTKKELQDAEVAHFNVAGVVSQT